MSVLQDIPLDKLSANGIYKSWVNAPVGAVLAYAGRCAYGSANNLEGSNNESVAIRVNDVDEAPCMFVIEPDAKLIELVKENSYFIEKKHITWNAPAIDISSCCELAVHNIGPVKKSLNDIVSGDIIVENSVLCVYVGCYDNHLFMSLSDDDRFKLHILNNAEVFYVGKLEIKSKFYHSTSLNT